MFDKHIPVSQIMTVDPVTVTPHDTMEKVQELFQSHSFHHLPVVEEGRVVGIISQADLYKLLHYFSLFRQHRSEEYNRSLLRSMLVRDVMSRKVVTLQPQDSLSVAAGIFRENLFHALPIVDEDKRLVGILTTYDLLTYAYMDEPLPLEKSED